MSYPAFVAKLGAALHRRDPLADFRNVVHLCFRYLPRAPRPTEMQYDFARYLVTGPDRLIAQVFRGFGKSTIAGMLPPWAWTIDPDLKFQVVAGEAGLAAQFSHFVLTLLRDVPPFQHLFPGPEQRSAGTEFDVRGSGPHRDPAMKSVGILGRLTGGHADWLISDDVEVPNTSDTVGAREKLANRIEEYEAVLNVAGRVTVLGTPQHEETVYRRLRSQGYDLRVYPARAPGGTYGKPERYQGVLAPYLVARISEGKLLPDEPTDPDRMDHEELLKREARYRAAGFALQYMLDPAESDAARRPLRLTDWIVADVDPAGARERVVWGSDPRLSRDDVPCLGVWGDRYQRPALEQGEFAPWGGTTMWVDPAGAGHDETAYAVTAVLLGQVYLLDWGGRSDDGSGDDVLGWIADRARANKVNEVVVERNFGDGMYTKLLGPHLRRAHPCRLTDERNTGRKLDRVLGALEPVMRSHRLVVAAGPLRAEAEWARRGGLDELQRTLAYQVSRISSVGPALPYDDKIEAVACAVRHWARALDVDAIQASREKTEAEEDAWLDAGAPLLGLGQPRSTSWLRNRGVPEARPGA